MGDNFSFNKRNTFETPLTIFSECAQTALFLLLQFFISVTHIFFICFNVKQMLVFLYEMHLKCKTCKRLNLCRKLQSQLSIMFKKVKTAKRKHKERCFNAQNHKSLLCLYDSSLLWSNWNHAFSTHVLYFTVSFKPSDFSLLISSHLCLLLVYSSPVSLLLLLHVTSIPICPTQLWLISVLLSPSADSVLGQLQHR